jgi:hypothetical protein
MDIPKYFGRLRGTMKVSELRNITSSLSVFATTREKASGPESLIGVQVVGGTGKFIAGNSRAATVVGASIEGDGKDQRFTIPARPFLQAAKVLPAKHEAELRVGDGRFSILAGGGGRVDIDAVGTIKEAGFAKKPSGFRASGEIAADDWKRISKLFKSISAKVMVPGVQHVSGRGYATAFSTTGSRYACISFPATGDNEYHMAAYLDFWEGLSAIPSDGVIQWGIGGVLAVGGGVEVFSAPYLTSPYNSETRTSAPPTEQKPWPILQIEGELETGFTVDRKKFIDVIKGQAPFDEHNRVTLQVDTGSLRVMPFGTESGMDFPVEVHGRGIRSVSADNLNGLLSNMDSKEVTLRWGAGIPAVSIAAPEYAQWTILLAPVTL